MISSNQFLGMINTANMRLNEPYISRIWLVGSFQVPTRSNIYDIFGWDPVGFLVAYILHQSLCLVVTYIIVDQTFSGFLLPYLLDNPSECSKAPFCVAIPLFSIMIRPTVH